jgi:hypothetical protein
VVPQEVESTKEKLPTIFHGFMGHAFALGGMAPVVLCQKDREDVLPAVRLQGHFAKVNGTKVCAAMVEGVHSGLLSSKVD